MRVVADHYAGFEGEAEYRFVALTPRGPEAVRLWEGHFVEMIELVSPGPDGWTSWARVFHLEEGWFDDSPWAEPNPRAALRQLESVDAAGLSAAGRSAYDDLTAFLRVTIRERHPLTIYYA